MWSHPRRVPQWPSEGKNFIDPVLLTPDGMPQPTLRRQRQDEDQERQTYQHHDNHFVGYYMAPPNPAFQFTGRGYEVQPTMGYDNDFGDKPPGQVIPLSPIPSLSNFRRSEMDGQSPIDAQAVAEWKTSTQASDLRQSPLVTNVGTSRSGFFSPRLDRPFSLFSDV
ncbi:hypothetical protein BKA70DRAFT_382706 [Coprinopsis sp. MPI-PUGE-AT-0042]|nr:hypothetical protein BKA70DRAFT_382706 [Coprinopsis sp. MPI-PUGE-AT-0042]